MRGRAILLAILCVASTLGAALPATAGIEPMPPAAEDLDALLAEAAEHAQAVHALLEALAGATSALSGDAAAALHASIAAAADALGGLMGTLSSDLERTLGRVVGATVLVQAAIAALLDAEAHLEALAIEVLSTAVIWVADAWGSCTLSHNGPGVAIPALVAGTAVLRNGAENATGEALDGALAVLEAGAATTVAVVQDAATGAADALGALATASEGVAGESAEAGTGAAPHLLRAADALTTWFCGPPVSPLPGLAFALAAVLVTGSDVLQADADALAGAAARYVEGGVP